MGGARLALQKGRHRPGIDPHERLARVDFRGLGGVDGLDADRAETGEVGRQIAWVRLVILVGPELQGVDEDRDDDVVGRFAGGAHEREVPAVERPHRHDERARPLQGGEGSGQFGLGACNFCHAHQSTGRGRGRFTRRKRRRLTSRHPPSRHPASAVRRRRLPGFGGIPERRGIGRSAVDTSPSETCHNLPTINLLILNHIDPISHIQTVSPWMCMRKYGANVPLLDLIPVK